MNKTKLLSFNEMWNKFIIPLEGKIFNNKNGSVEIESITHNGVKRISSQGNSGFVNISYFRNSYELLLQKKSLSRAEINNTFGGRCSSLVLILLSQVPYISVTKVNKRDTLLLVE